MTLNEKTARLADLKAKIESSKLPAMAKVSMYEEAINLTVSITCELAAMQMATVDKVNEVIEAHCNGLMYRVETLQKGEL